MYKMLSLDTQVLVAYNWADCLATARTHVAIMEEMAERRMLDYYERAVWPLVEPVLAMQRRGLLVDQEALADYRGRLHSELAQLEEGILKHDLSGELAKATPKSPNGLSSPKRLGAFLYGRLGLQCHKRSEQTKQPSTDQEALLRCLAGLRKKDEHARPVLYDLLHRSRLHTIYTRYLEMPVWEDNRVRPRVKLGGTRTGRFAYADPPLQQIPKEARYVFVPRAGYSFLAADYSQLEARIAAIIARDDATASLFASGGDIHAANARSLFGWVLAEWEALPPETRKAARNYAKTFYYGAILYGGEPETVKMKTYCPCPRCEASLPPTHEVSRPKVTEASRRYFASHPCYMVYRDEVDREVRTNQSLVNPLGRKRFFMEPWPRCKRAAWNWPIQSTAADIINRAMVRLHQRYDAPIALQMHDALYLEVPNNELALWTTRVRDTMEEPIPELGGTSFPVDVEIECPWGVTGKAVS